MSVRSTSLRNRLLVGASASALVLSGGPAEAGPAASNPFARVSNPAAQAAQAAAAQAAQGSNATVAAQRALAAFAQAAAIRKNMDAAQRAARAATAAARAHVPNGLGAGGLQVDPGVVGDPSLWLGANAPTQTTGSDGRTKVDVTQTQAQAILNWQTFNVGQQTDLTFTQGASTWAILNKVNDPSANPTQILGTIKAPGTVLIMNRNGVIFGGTSQVNVGNLLAAAGTMTDDQFSKNGIYSTQNGGQYVPSITDALGEVKVDAGAQISTNTPTSVTQGGGYVMLVGGSVENDGAITTPMGQTLLAAGDDFNLRPGYGTTANQYSTTKGSEVAPLIAADSTNGTVTNAGDIYSQQGDITLAGRTITQAGVALSTTDVNQRGTIHLLNSASDSAGSITLTDNSLTAILPELTSGQTALDVHRDQEITDSTTQDIARETVAETSGNTQFDDLSLLSDRKDQSRVEMVTGGNIEFQGGSYTLAQGGQISATAGNRIQVDTGAWLDTSGVRDVAMNVSDNSIFVNVQGNELRDDPINRNNPNKPLYSGADDGIWVDVNDLIYVPAGTGGDAADRYYTPGGLLEVSGWIGNTGHTIGEWDAVGGSITLQAKEVVAQAGSTFNISGGTLDYAGGTEMETILQGADGNIYTANNAPADIEMVSVGTSFQVLHPRWGDQYTQTYHNPFAQKTIAVKEDGYIVGKDAGQLILAAPTILFNGDIDAEVVQGTTQNQSRQPGVTDGYKLPQNVAPLAGTLAVGQYGGLGVEGGFNTDVVFGDITPITSGISLTTALPSTRTNTAWFDASQLSAEGLGGLNVLTSDDVTVAAPLALTPGAQITFAAPDIAIAANLTAHSGNVTLDNILSIEQVNGKLSPISPMLDAAGTSSINIHNAAAIDLSGLWVNALQSPADGAKAAFINGGNLDVYTTGSVSLAAGSAIDVTSGAAVLVSGKTQGGRGGSVALSADDYSKLDYHALWTAQYTDAVSNPLIVDGAVKGYGFTGGGTLTLNAGQTVIIGQDASLSGGTLAAGTAAATSVTLAQPVTLPAGTVMPVTYVLVKGDNTGSDFMGYTAGQVLQSAVTLPAGFNVPAGTVFAQDVAIRPALTLSSDLFQTGFSNYAVSSTSGVELSPGTTLAATVPVYRFAPGSLSAPTGTAPGQAAILWTPPVFTPNPTTDVLTQRPGASVTLGSLYDLTLGQGSSIAVDPGQSVGLYVNGQATLLGDITAHGGSITIASLQVSDPQTGDPRYNYGWGDFSLTRSTWIGSDAVLDVSGQAVTALDMFGRTYGEVQNGGAILIGSTGALNDGIGGSRIGPTFPVASDAFIIIRPGAVLNASGASATLDLASTGDAGTSLSPVLDVTSGGTIGLYTSTGAFIDGSLLAKSGGAGASGGELDLQVSDHMYYETAPSVADPYGIGIQPYATPAAVNGYIGVVPDAARVSRNITLVQDNIGSGLGADLRPGQTDPALLFGSGTLGVNQITAGGFDTVSLRAGDLFTFRGNVDLSLGKSLTLAGGYITSSAATPSDTVTLAAPYVHLTGRTAVIAVDGHFVPGINISHATLPSNPNSSFTLSGDLIDLDGPIQFGLDGADGGTGAAGSTPVFGLTAPLIPLPDEQGFSHVVFDSTGDVRFGTGTISVPNLTIQAAQAYPLSNAQMSINVGQYQSENLTVYDPDATFTLLGDGGAPPPVPASVFGQLTINARNIVQDGVLRAPLGNLSFSGALNPVAGFLGGSGSVTFGPASITSVSANGLTMPFGGTSDGITYTGLGTLQTLGATANNANAGATVAISGISITDSSIVADSGALLDLSGGGNLTGAGFIGGRGGSVDVLTTPLVNANPANGAYSSAGDQVYAIVPGYASSYAPIIASNGAGNPGAGQQITIGSGVPGLAAGTYTLLPSSYALLPGGFRIEIGKSTTVKGAANLLGNGSIATNGILSVANTGFKSALPVQVVVSSGAAVRDYSQYNETSYSEFATTQTTQFGGIRPVLPEDGKVLHITLALDQNTQTDTLAFNGTTLLGGNGSGSISGTLMLDALSPGTINITAPGAAPVAGQFTISSAAINAFDAPTVMIGGGAVFSPGGSAGAGPLLFFQSRDTSNPNAITVSSGADIQAGQIFLIGSAIDIASGSTIDTHGLSSSGIDSSTGYLYANAPDPGNAGTASAVLAVANGFFNFLPSFGPGTIDIASGANLLTDGTIAIAAPGGAIIGDNVNFGARYLAVSQQAINIGSTDSLATASTSGALPSGWNLTQDVIDRLLTPSTTSGLPALQELILTAGGSINFIGSVALNASGHGGNPVELVLNTPAVYGLGASGDVASLTADSVAWNGVRTGNGGQAQGSLGVLYGNQAPAPIVAGGPGTGLGTLQINAPTILFGYDANSQRTDGVTLQRYAVGFSSVDLHASTGISANSDGTLTVGQSLDSNGKAVGGALTVTTPLLWMQNGADFDVTAGGAITISAPAGVAATNTSTAIGGQLSFHGASIALNTAVTMPSGQLTLTATGDISLGSGADIDLAGRGLVFDDLTKYSWGGNLIMTSADGSITQAAGSVIDVSATNNDAGAITASAPNGQALFSGTLKGAGGTGFTGGQFSIAAQGIGNFDVLNNVLSGSGFNDALSFDIRSGDLMINQTVKAHNVTISVDAGSLTVDGLIDASGAAPGSILLSARGDLTLAPSAMLDAHGSVLQADSHGAPIDAENRATVELTTAKGTLTLSPGVVIDVSSLDPNPQGQLILDAPRLGGNGVSATTGASVTDPVDGTLTTGANAPVNAQGNDIAIQASGPLTIKGAAGIVLNGFATYANAPIDPNDANGQIINQGYLDLIDQDSNAFVNGALANTDLAGRIAGLTAYGSAFHLRPGVEIDSATSNGNLTVSGGVDLSGYRYGPNAPAGGGAGEPMDLVIRAGANLTVKGSISDGFVKETLVPGSAGSFTPVDFSTDTTDLTFVSDPSQLTGLGPYYMNAPGYGLNSDLYVDQPWTIPNDSFYQTIVYFQDVNGVQYTPGSTIPAGTQLDYTVGGGFELGAPLPVLSVSFTPGAPTTGTPAVLQPMLAPGTMSASLRLVGGSDLAAANSRILRTAAALNGAGNVVLDAPYSLNAPDGTLLTGVSVIRTGTGDLDILAGGNFQEQSLFGIYTAGTAIPEMATAANDPYNPSRGTTADGTVLGAANASLESTFNPHYMYYTQGGGNLMLTAQGDITSTQSTGADRIGGWLWREGGSGPGQATAWGINFGSYTAPGGTIGISTFDGIGTLGGGNVTIAAGGDIGDGGTGIVAAVGGSGRVLADGSLAQTGGGILTVSANGIGRGNNVKLATGVNQFVDLRGDINVLTGSFGTITSTDFGFDNLGSRDPRLLNALTPYNALVVAGGEFAPGDGVVDLRARGDIGIGGVSDPGRVGLEQDTAAPDGTNSVTWFTLWTDRTAIDMVGGGSVSPVYLNQSTQGNFSLVLPSILNATAAGGNIYLAGGSLMMPSPDGVLNLLATGSVIDVSPGAVGPLAVSTSTIPTPFKPAWEQISPASGAVVASNYWTDPTQIVDNQNRYPPYVNGAGGGLFIFGPETVTDDSAVAASGVVSHIYALNGDILSLDYGEVYRNPANFTNYYHAAKPVDILAGGDIVDLSGMILHNNPTDVSTVAASGDVLYAGFLGLEIAGPGTLEVTAGGTLYQGSSATIESIGPLVTGDNRPGANVVLQGGVGPGTPGVGQVNWNGFAALYLNAANQADAAIPDTDPANAGKVPQTYQAQLYAWLQQNFGYAGDQAGAYAYFETLPPAQQRVFLRTVYYDELNEGGLEYNEPTSKRYRSYLRGRDAIAELFPNQSAYNGGIIMFSTSAATSMDPTATVSGYVHTDFGGDIQLLAPGGEVQVGSESVSPGADAGLITQGAGDIDIYADDSVLLGLSRIMTTFGGDITIWSATGDINAGRGSKTTVVFTPPKIVYDNYGNLTLAPVTPSTGAGIATLAPIPQVPPGNVNLVAPLGTIDAGEAGIRVSGNVNIAALHVVNAANIQVKGTATGVPTDAVVNTNALTTASSAASAVSTEAERLAERARPQLVTEMPAILQVRFVGFGDMPD